MVMVSTLPVFLAGASFVQLQDDIGLTASTLGAVTAAFFLTASITSTPLGRLVERIGWRPAMRINCLVSAAVLLAIPVAVSNPTTLGALLVVAGAVYGFTNPAANHALALGSPRNRRGVVFGLKHAGIPASTLAAGASVPLLVVTLGWRPTFALTSSVALIAWLLINSEPKREHHTVDLSSASGEVRPLTSTQLATLAFGSALATWAAVFLGTFLVAAGVDRSLSESQAGLLLFAGSAVSIASRVTYGTIADRRKAAGFAGVSVIMALGAVAVFFIAEATGGLFVLTVCAAFALGWGWPGLMTYAVVNANSGSAASSSAVTQAGIFFGAGAGPIVLGWIVDTASFQTAWLTVALLLAIAAGVVSYVAIQRRPRGANG